MTAFGCRIRLTTIAVLGAATLSPAGALASTTWFGSSLNHDPANAGTSCAQDQSLPSPKCTHVGSFYPGTSGRVKATTSGRIVKIKVRAQGPMTMRFQLVRVRHLSADEQHGQAKVIVTGPKLHVPGPNQTQLNDGVYPVQSFRVSIPVQKGEELAITTSNNQAEYCSDGTPGQLTFFNPALSFGAPFRTNSGVDDCLLLVQAVIRH
jgi:hypothetical protein